MNKKNNYRFLEHTADIMFQAKGGTIEECFSNSAMALKEVITKNQKIKSKIKKSFLVESPNKNLKDIDYEKVLYNFLEEFLFLLDSEGFILSKVSLKMKSGRLETIVFGDNIKNYKISNDVKAITYNKMFVKKQKDKWISQVVLDV